MATGTRGRTVKSRSAKRTVAVAKPTSSDGPAGELKKNLDAVLAENATLRKENERLTGILTDIVGLAAKTPAVRARVTKARATKAAATRISARSTTKLASSRRDATRRSTKKPAAPAGARSSSTRARRATTAVAAPAISTAPPAAIG